ncbi:Protein kinase domain-containing protein [Abeliophyllum distichum]|uniref:Protein kinase domain-containing protein n=1 Tax=Abeliophyllum distichum TaxID=126358 RepID=A0ABD1NVW0_9LAMI
MEMNSSLTELDNSLKWENVIKSLLSFARLLAYAIDTLRALDVLITNVPFTVQVVLIYVSHLFVSVVPSSYKIQLHGSGCKAFRSIRHLDAEEGLEIQWTSSPESCCTSQADCCVCPVVEGYYWDLNLGTCSMKKEEKLQVWPHIKGVYWSCCKDVQSQRVEKLQMDSGEWWFWRVL